MRIPRPNFADILDAIQQLAGGATNAGGAVTLSAGATSTTVIAKGCRDASMVVLSPRTPAAAAAGAWVAATAKDTFTIGHVLAGAGCDFDYEVRNRE